MTIPDVVVVGEPIVSLVGGTPEPIEEVATFTVHETGSELNVAVGLSRLGVTVGYIGCVGDDPFGRRLIARMRREAIRVDHVVVRSRPTALLARDLRAGGSTEVSYHRAGSAGSQLDTVQIEDCAPWLAGSRWLHVSGVTPALGASAAAATQRAVQLAGTAGVGVSLDVNLRLRLWSAATAREHLRPMVALADIVFTSVGELLVLTAAADEQAGIAMLHAWGAAQVVVTRGAHGATASGVDGLDHQPSELVTWPVDTVGAGDAFVAGYLWQHLMGGGISDSLLAGARVAAVAISSRGDLEGLPRAASLEWPADGEPTR